MLKEKNQAGNNKDIHQVNRITNLNTFNKYLLSISTAGYTFIVYAMYSSNQMANVTISHIAMKVCLVCITISILATMLALILMIDDPKPMRCKSFFINVLDWIAFSVFIFAVILLTGAIMFA